MAAGGGGGVEEGGGGGAGLGGGRAGGGGGGGGGPMDKLSFLLRFAENLKLPYEIHVFERSLGPPG